MWKPIEAATPEIWEIAKVAAEPRIGLHIGKTFTLSDGRWLVLKFPSTSGRPDFFCVLDEPPDFKAMRKRAA